MAQTETSLLTVEEYAKIPDPPGGRYELHHGECVLVPPPMMEHTRIQRQSMLLLTRYCPGFCAAMEFPFRPLPEHEVWVADVGMVTEQRWRSNQRRGWLSGSPDLVAEVLSPSNTVQEINDKRQICFQGGCKEFWVLDPKLKTIEVSTPDGQARTYTVNDEIPLDRFVPGKLRVAEVFAE
jgi:Uma2 family endonuclease